MIDNTMDIRLLIKKFDMCIYDKIFYIYKSLLNK